MKNLKVEKWNVIHFFSSVFFFETQITFSDFNNKFWNNVVKIASTHLVIPTFYSLLKQQNKLGELPPDLVTYLSYIYEENWKRNRALIQEVNYLSKLFQKHEIEHVFLKGAALITSGIIQDAGARMVGDIDVLVADKDQNKAIEILTSVSEGYYYNESYQPKKHHFPRLGHPTKIFAVEVHKQLLKKNRKLLSPMMMLKNKVKKEIFIPSPQSLLTHCIYNDQVNDDGYLYSYFSFRSLYDFFILKKFYSLDISLKGRDKWIRNFLIKAAIYGRFYLDLRYLKFRDFCYIMYHTQLLKSKWFRQFMYVINRLIKALKEKKFRDHLFKRYVLNKF